MTRNRYEQMSTKGLQTMAVEGFGIGPRDVTVMASALKKAGLDEKQASSVLEALLKKHHMLIDSNTYSSLWIHANTHGGF